VVRAVRGLGSFVATFGHIILEYSVLLLRC